MNAKDILFIFIAIAVGFVVGFGLINYFRSNSLPSLPPSKTAYKNISYQIEGMPVLLQNGQAEKVLVDDKGNTLEKTVYNYFGNEARGDFNRDEKEDMAFLLTSQSSGSGTFYYLVVALGAETGYIGTNAIFIGDRIAPQTTEFRDGKIIVNYADRNTGEPMTTPPSLGVSKYFVINNGQLEMAP